MLSLNQWDLAGRWTIGGEFATLVEAPGSIAYRFHARDLHLVLVPPSPAQMLQCRVTIDNSVPGDSHAFDIDAQGLGTVRDARLYQLVRQAGPIVDRTFRIEFLDQACGRTISRSGKRSGRRDRRIKKFDDEFAMQAKTDDGTRRLATIFGSGALNADAVLPTAALRQAPKHGRGRCRRLAITVTIVERSGDQAGRGTPIRTASARVCP